MRSISSAAWLVVLGACGGAMPASTPVRPAAAPPIAVPQWLGTDAVVPGDVAFVGDGSTIVVVGPTYASAIDAATGHARAVVPRQDHWQRHAVPSRDGHSVATGDGLWSLDDGTRMRMPLVTLAHAYDAAHMTSWVNDGLVLASAERFVLAGAERTFLFDARGEVIARDLPPRGLQLDVATDPTGRSFLIHTTSGLVIVASADGAVRGTIPGVWPLGAFSDDGARLLIGNVDGSLASVDVGSGAMLAHADLEGGLMGIAPNGAWALIGRPGHTLLVDGTTLAVVADAEGIETHAWPVLVAPNGAFVADPYDRAIEVHDLRAGTTRSLGTAPASALAIDATARRVLVHTETAMSLYDGAAPEPAWSVRRASDLPIRDLHVLDGHLFVSSSDRTWDVAPDGSQRELPCGFGDPHRGPDGSIVLGCLLGSNLDLASGEVLVPEGMTVVDMSDDGSIALVATDAGFDAYDLRARAHRSIAAQSFAGGPVLWASEALTSDGARLAISDVGGVRIVDPHTGEVAVSMPVDGDAIVRFVDRDRRLLIAYADGRVSLRDGVTLVEIASLPPAPGTPGLFGDDAASDEYTNGSLTWVDGYVVIGGRGERVVFVDGDALREGVLLAGEGIWLTTGGGRFVQHIVDDHVADVRAMPEGTVLADPPWVTANDGTTLRCDDGEVRRAPGTPALASCDYANTLFDGGESRFVVERSESVAHIARVATGERLYVALVKTGDDVALVTWDDRGRVTGLDGVVLDRAPGPWRDAALSAPEQGDVVRAFVAER